MYHQHVTLYIPTDNIHTCTKPIVAEMQTGPEKTLQSEFANQNMIHADEMGCSGTEKNHTTKLE